MADNVSISAGTGTTIAADDVGGALHQRVKISLGADGTAADAPGDGTYGIDVDITRVNDVDTELGLASGRTGLRDDLVAQRYTVVADSLADGLAGFWTSATANGGTTTSSGGEGLIQTSANATGSAQITSTPILYFPGQVSWFNSAARFNDTGSAGNIRRIGVFTVSGTTPQNGAYYELNGTTLNAVYVNATTATTVASTSWSKVATAPFTLDTNFHFFEIRFTGNTFWFYIDNVLRHQVSGTSAPTTATLNFPMTVTSVNTSGASNRLIAVRNIGVGRFGDPAQIVNETGLSAVNALAVSGGTPHDSVDSGNPMKVGAKAIAHGANPTAVAAADRTDVYANRAGIPFVMGGHPNIVTVKHTTITTAVTDAAIVTISSGLKIVVTSLTVTLDNASTVFPTVLIGFGATTTPTTTGVIAAHGGVPAGGGFNRGDGSGILGVGADGEDLRVTTTGNATGNGLQIVVGYHTIES